MDGVSAAASIIAIAGAGVRIVIKLVTLATQISTASERVSSIGNEISLTSGVLHQLGELMTQKTTDDEISIFSKGGMETTRTSAAMCERIFLELEKETRRASEQMRECRRSNGAKIKLSKAEKAKWPFLQPSIDILRADLREAKGTLMLMLQVTSLALSKKMVDINQSAFLTISEQRDFMRAIVALQQAQQDALTFRESKEHEMTRTRLEETCRQPSSTGTHKSLTSDADEADSPTSAISAHSTAVPPSLQTSAGMNIGTVGINSSDQTYSEANGSRELNPQDGNLPLNSYVAAVQTSNFPSVTTSDRHWPGGSGTERSSLLDKDSSSNPHRSGSKFDMELQLFLMKPIVRDFFDKIELTWSVHNPKMQDSAIRKYIAKNEDDGIPSVLDMLHTLHDYERIVVDSRMHDRVSGCEGSLLSLKRTKTEILHRNITLKDVPGLQFVVERAILPPGPHIWNRREGMPPPPQCAISYNISGYKYAPQEQPMQLVIPGQQSKRKLSTDARRKKPTRKRFSQGTHTPPPDVLNPQIPDEDTTNEDLFMIPLSSRAQASDRSPSPNDQYTSYDRLESSIPGPTKGRDYQQAMPIRTNERPQLTVSVNACSVGGPSNYPLLASHQLQAKPSLGMAPIEQKGHPYPDETSLPTTAETTRVEALKARATSLAQDGNTEDKKVLTGDVQKTKAPGYLTSMHGAEAPDEPSHSLYLSSSEDSFHEAPKTDSTKLPTLVSTKFRKQRGTIKRRSFDKIVEVTHPRFNSANVFERLHEVPRMSTSFSDMDFYGGVVQRGRTQVHGRSLRPPDDSIPRTAFAVDLDSGVANPLIVKGPVSDCQTGDQEYWSVDEEESKMEEEPEVDVNEEYAVVNELLRKYTTLFDQEGRALEKFDLRTDDKTSV